VVLSGFSMGGGLAIWLALRGYIRARGFLIVAPYLPYEYVEAPEMTITPSNPLRGYVVVGEQDDPTFGFSEKFTTRIEQAGIPCQRVSYPGLEHDYPPDFDAVLLQGLQFIG
jgi:acetyl esterase/lipase